MDKLKQAGQVAWNWTLSRVEMVRSWLPPDIVLSPWAKWIAGAAFGLVLVVSILLGDGKATRLEIVQAVIAMFGLAGLAANAIYTLKRANAIEEQVKVSDDAQITERFSRAIEHLGSNKPQIMIGGIYALERIAKDYQDNYHQTVMEVLTTFIRGFEREEPVEKVPPELQAAVTVVCRRDVEWEKVNLPDFTLDLSGANLSHVQMQEAKLAGANLMKANLTGVNLYQADLTQTFFLGANLSNAHILEATLFETTFLSADLRGVDFTGLVLSGNFLSAENLTLQQVKRVESYQDAMLPVDIQAELDAYIEAMQAKANPTSAEPVEVQDSVEEKLPNADVTEPGQSEDDPGAQQEDVEGSA